MVATIRLHIEEHMQWHFEQMPPQHHSEASYPFDDLPLNARVSITIPPRDSEPTPENLKTIETVVHVRRNLPKSPARKALYFIVEKDLTVRLIVMTEAEIEAMQKSKTRPD